MKMRFILNPAKSQSLYKFQINLFQEKESINLVPIKATLFLCLT